MPLTESCGIRLRSSGGMDWKKSQRSRSTSRCSAIGSMLIALWRTSVLLFAGQTSTQTPQPVQSSGATWIVSRWSGSSRERNSLCRKSAGAASTAAVGNTFIRIVACGQTIAHLPQSMQIAGIPDRDHLGDRPLLVLRRPAREGAVDRERADRQLVAVAGHQARRDPGHEVGHVIGHRRGRRKVVGDAAERDVGEALERPVDGLEVAGDDRLAALRIGLLDEALDPRDRLVRGQDARELEEARLHDGVDPAAHAGLVGDGQRVDHPEVDLLVDEQLLDAARQVVPDLVGPVRGVEQERRPVLRSSSTLVLPSSPNWWQATKSASSTR